MTSTQYENVKTAAQAERERRKLHKVWSSESQLSQRILICCLEQLQQIAKATVKKRAHRRAIGEWEKFFGRAMKQGVSAKEAAASWKKHKDNQRSR